MTPLSTSTSGLSSILFTSSQASATGRGFAFSRINDGSGGHLAGVM